MASISRRVKWMLAVALLVTVGAVVSVAMRPPSPREQFFRVRDDLLVARAAVDSCIALLEAQQDRFRERVGRVDSIRDRIDDFEALDDRGVPADSYALYLAAVDSFNAGIPGWDAEADTLREQRRQCEKVIRVHNTLADSARALAEAAELLPPPHDP